MRGRVHAGSVDLVVAPRFDRGWWPWLCWLLLDNDTCDGPLACDSSENNKRNPVIVDSLKGSMMALRLARVTRESSRSLDLETDKK